ncbi:hypothetical protein LCGC14_1404670 [marine sediment metagenome]|uniref:Uncharacterized protein n=1 Tax=marine sediment metagenome TaxID=412755 RepID=A0A0F9MXM3_9ZZZZ
MATVVGGRRLKKIPGLRSLKLSKERPLAVAIANGGMVADIDPADIKDNQFVIVKNARVRRDKTTRRNGKSSYLPTKPNSNAVIRMYDHKIGDTTFYRIRLTAAGIHFTGGSAWTALSGTFSGKPTDIASVLGTLVVANGIDRLRKLDLDAETISDLGTIAPRAKYVTGFSERVVGANVGDSDDAVENLWWSGNRNLSEFDALEDISAGNKRLDTSPRVVTDPIKGVFGFSSVMIIPRERSIWLATQNPTASNPFNTFRAVPGVGTDLPGSIAIGKEKIIFIDGRTRDVVKYSPGQPIQSIGSPIRDSMLVDATDPGAISSTYFEYEDEYYFTMKESGTVKIWVANFKTGAWGYDEIADLTSIDSLTGFSDYTSFDSAMGTFDAATGTFDAASVTPVTVPLLVYGFSTGLLLQEDSSVQQDNSVDYTFELRSKEFKRAREDVVITRIVIEYQATVSGDIILQYSRDGGTTWNTGKTVTTSTGKVREIKLKKQIRTKRLMWRITATDGQFDILGYEVDISVGGESEGE